MTPTPAPMTAGEAARAFEAAEGMWREDHTDLHTYAEFVADWFARNWPAGGAVTVLTGRRLYEAIHGDAGPYVLLWSQLEADAQQRYDRAAARLSAHTVVDESGNGRHLTHAPLVAFDVEAVCAEVERIAHNGNWQERHVDAETLAKSIRRHAAALRVNGRPRDAEWQAAFVSGINTRLRALATTAGQTTQPSAETIRRMAQELTAELPITKGVAFASAVDTVADVLTKFLGTGTAGAQWVRRPEPQAGALVVPEDGWYAREEVGVIEEDGNVVQGTLSWWRAGQVVHHSIVRIKRVDTDAPTTWIERTLATAGGWTAASVEACVGRYVVEAFADADDLSSTHWKDGETAERIAECFNGWGVVAYYILPPVEATP
jgi:hypothetical protein